MNAAFWGAFLAVAVGIGIIAAVIRQKIRGFSRQVFGKADILQALSELDGETQDTPRSLSGCGSLLLPQILRDFPDFDPNLAKTYARDYLRETFRQKEGFTVHNVVIARYLPSAAQKTIVLQAAVSWLENGKRLQKRFDLDYTYLLSGSGATVAANCPNCGGALGYGVTECPYCGSRITNVLGNSWKFTEIRES